MSAHRGQSCAAEPARRAPCARRSSARRRGRSSFTAPEEMRRRSRGGGVPRTHGAAACRRRKAAGPARGPPSVPAAGADGLPSQRCLRLIPLKRPRRSRLGRDRAKHGRGQGPAPWTRTARAVLAGRPPILLLEPEDRDMDYNRLGSLADSDRWPTRLAGDRVRSGVMAVAIYSDETWNPKQ